MSGGRWRAEIARGGVRSSKVFDSKRTAQDWAAREEYLILNGSHKVVDVSFGDVMKRYGTEISPTKRGVKWEIARIEKFRQADFASKPVGALAALDFARWRDLRLTEVAPGTVKREMSLLSGILTVSRKEWGLIKVNPMADVRKPTKPPARDRTVTDAELERLAISAGGDLSKKTARAFHAFLFAIETAMRAGEIIGLRPDDVDLKTRVCHLPMTKNGTSRDVPLSSEAVRLIEALPPADTVFDLNSAQLDALWRKLRDRAAVKGLTFHDSRHTAITRLAKKIEVLDLARMTGHRNIGELLTYYNPKASDIAKQLD
jgi:integrase